jgi:hypothetical protein
LWLQIKSKLLAGEAGVSPRRRISFLAFFGRTEVVPKTLFIAMAARTVVTGPHHLQAEG